MRELLRGKGRFGTPLLKVLPFFRRDRERLKDEVVKLFTEVSEIPIIVGGAHLEDPQVGSHNGAFLNKGIPAPQPVHPGDVPPAVGKRQKRFVSLPGFFEIHYQYFTTPMEDVNR